MIDFTTLNSIATTLVPPIVTGLVAYFVARRKHLSVEKINKAELDAQSQSQALNIVKNVMNDMRDEFRREINGLKDDNERMRMKIDFNESEIKVLHSQLRASDELIVTLRAEIGALRSTVKIYEDELARVNRD